MSRTPALLLLLASALIPSVSGYALARDLTFDQRVAGQEAIERVYYSHQIGTTKPFEEAVPQSILEQKVLTYLKESAALEQLWGTPLTAAALEVELQRVAGQTRMPSRLREIYRALGGDAFLVQECFIRPILVDRLMRDRFSRDPQIHEEARQASEALRLRLLSGDIDILGDFQELNRLRHVMTPRLREGLDGHGFPSTQLLIRNPSQGDPTVEPTQIGPVLEQKDSFIVRVHMEVGAPWMRLLSYVTKKEAYDSWWSRNEQAFVADGVQPVASEDSSLPLPNGSLQMDGLSPKDAWTTMSTDSAPEARRDHSAVWTGNLMVIWGGYDDNSSSFRILGDGARYDPLTDTWRPLPMEGAPLPQVYSTAVWTGREMIVWGGYVPQKNGGRYDPIADRWSPVSTNSAPRGRYGHTAVWTGSKMIVWGGNNNGGFLFSDGSAYDPSNDTWSPISNAGAPGGRFFHAAVWSGHYMIVWGGSNGSGQNPTGGRYDPITDSWTEVTGMNAPSARESLTAVWSGLRMVVWGGYTNLGGTQLLATGGQYDPESDTWTVTSAIGAPVGRAAHTAVWTGSDMIVWGGFAAPFGSSTDTGGRYDPAADSWQSMSTEGTPLPRYSHTAVWTGESMIIWGGVNSSNYLPLLFDTGGLYHVKAPNRPPEADGGPDIRIECSSPTGTPVRLDGSGSTDPDSTPGTNDDITLFEWILDYGLPTQQQLGQGMTLSTLLPIGSSHVTLRVTDSQGELSTDTIEVAVVDTTPPQIASALNSTLLWPPNHRMVDVGASVAATDACSTPTVILTSVTSSEPDDSPGGGDGSTLGDIQGAEIGTSDFDFQLRAERDAAREGRAYRLTYTAVDGSGNQAGASSIVFVPHDQGGSTEPVLISANSDEIGTVLAWDPVPGTATYRVVRGNVTSLSDAGAFIDLGAVTCLQRASAATSTNGSEDAEIPPVGEAFFYVVAYNDGNDSGYGSATATKPRVATGGECQ